MKYFIFLFLILGLFSCQKPQLNRPTDVIKPAYLGIYDGVNSDTCYVTLNGDYTQIKWIYTSGFTITFDSVKVTNDTLFTVNVYRDWETDRKSTRLNSSHSRESRMPSSA